MRRDRFRDKVLREGLDGTATVRRVAWYDEGNSTGDDFPELHWDLEVQVGGGTPYELDGGFQSPAWAADVVKPGTQLPVKVHPSKQKRVAIDWDAWDVSGGRAAAEAAAQSASANAPSMVSAAAEPDAAMREADQV